jgi:carbonic anhydrase
VRSIFNAGTLPLLLVLLPGCDKIQGLVFPAKAGEGAPGVSAEPPKKADGPQKQAKAEAKGEGPDEYALPFAWETSTNEPLGRTRGFLKEMFVTNGDYMSVGARLFPTFADRQTPRATILTCADSRVHTTAFDASPENDDFMVRNLGNQVENAAGSIEYGVEHLDTPLLFILGHTGCGAVHAAMEGLEKFPGPIQAELKNLHAPKHDARKGDREAWVNAVVDNVHDQVSVALSRFGKRVHSGRLTIVGAVLDFRNDIGLGAGRLILVDVNGNQDQKRIAAFIEAVTGHAAPEPHLDDARTSAAPAADLRHALAALPKGKATHPPASGDKEPRAEERKTD